MQTNRSACASNVASRMPLPFDPHPLFVRGGAKRAIAAAVVFIAALAG